MFKIRYVNAVLDGSGYASCGRSYIKALIDSGNDVKIKAVSFENARPDIGKFTPYIKPNISDSQDFDINIVHLTPEHFPNNFVYGKINIGLTVWETTRIPDYWVDCCNKMDAIIVPCSWNKEVFTNSGVTVPIYVVPHVVDLGDTSTIKEFKVNGVPDDAFKFYSIWQFTERKDPLSLLKAYWHAFSEDDNVALIIKTYRSDYSDAETKVVVETIQRIKQSMKMTPEQGHAPVYLVTNMLSYDEILGLHKYGDCFVSFARAEGFGLPMAEAAVLGRPVVTTGFGGVLEFLNADNSLLSKYTLTPVSGMPHIPWYTGDQLWAQADVKHGSDLMRRVYDDSDLYRRVSAKALNTVKPLLSYENVSSIFNSVLNDIRG